MERIRSKQPGRWGCEYPSLAGNQELSNQIRVPSGHKQQTRDSMDERREAQHRVQRRDEDLGEEQRWAYQVVLEWGAVHVQYEWGEGFDGSHVSC